MPEPRLSGEHDPQALPEPLRRLHRRAMAAIRQERQAKPSDVDETGRTWPGLVNPPPRQPNP